MRYAFILEVTRSGRLYPLLTIKDLCRLLEVARSGYYAWLAGERNPPQVSPAQARRRELRAKVCDVFSQFEGRAGSRKIVAMLRHKGITIGRYLVRQLMRENGLVCLIRRQWKASNKAASEAVYPNLLKTAGNSRVFVSDITYIRTLGGKWSYLAVVMEAESRLIVGWAYGMRMPSGLVIDALDCAVRHYGKRALKGAIVHSDRGSQYASKDYQHYLARHGLRGSMGRSCYENAKIERFHGTLKDHLIVGRQLCDVATMRERIGHWIEIVYNCLLPHSVLGVPPMEYQKQHATITFPR